MKIIVTGGAGYIGSHTCLELLIRGHDVLAFDDLSNGCKEALKRVQEISGKKLSFSVGDIRSDSFLNEIFSKFKPDAVVHFAGLKAVSESLKKPLKYYDVNVLGSLRLLSAMDRWNCKNIVFSSSATVYGTPVYLPYDESHPRNPSNCYGNTKLLVEELLRDWTSCSADRRATSLRYFNPVGAHSSGLIGEHPVGIPNNLMPYISQVAIGKRDHVSIFGGDYNTADGTGERDYVHVVELAKAHVIAVEKQMILDNYSVFNLGSGQRVSVLKLIKTFEKVAGIKIKKRIVERRVGDLPSFWANGRLASSILEVKFEKTIIDMCEDTWRWQLKNPNGYS